MRTPSTSAPDPRTSRALDTDEPRLALPANAPWVRLAPAPAPLQGALSAAGTSTVALWPLAIEPIGRRCPAAPLIDDTALAALVRAPAEAPFVLPLLDHAGPEAGRFSTERPIGPAAVGAPTSGRVPAPLEGVGLSRLLDRYAEAAGRLAATGVRGVVLGADDDGLLASFLSPRANPGRALAERLAPVLDALTAVRQAGLVCGVAVCVEELCPGGLDPTDGVAIAAALAHAGAAFLVASGGSEALPILKRRAGAHVDDDAPLASAAWLLGRVEVPVLAEGPFPSPARALGAARACGLAGIVARAVAPLEVP